jgi:hypothetical protein
MAATPSGKPIDDQLDRLHVDLRLKRLNPIWAKAEILLGLIAASSGLLIGIYGVVRSDGESNWLLLVASVLLQTLGTYLALAGHRSHLYQSQNKLAAWLATQISNRDT